MAGFDRLLLWAQRDPSDRRPGGGRATLLWQCALSNQSGLHEVYAVAERWFDRPAPGSRLVLAAQGMSWLVSRDPGGKGFLLTRLC